MSHLLSTNEYHTCDPISTCTASPQQLLAAIDDALSKDDDELVESLLCGAVKYLKVNRAKPDPSVYLTLMYLAKHRPTLFNSEVLIEVNHLIKCYIKHHKHYLNWFCVLKLLDLYYRHSAVC